MARFEFKLPDIGEGIAEAEITAWHVKIGDYVEEDQPLADMMTDKATVEMESPASGKVVELAGAVGDQIPIGSVLVVLETDAGPEERKDSVAFTDGLVEQRSELSDSAPSMSEEEENRRSDRRAADRRAAEAERRSVKRPEADRRQEERRAGPRRASERSSAKDLPPPPVPGRILASPAVRKRARDLGIDLGQVRAAAGDRIRHADLDAYLLYSGGAAPGAAPLPRRDEQIKIVGLRRKIAENMQESKRHIPHFTYVEEADVTALETTRAMMNDSRGDNPKLSLLPFTISAICRAVALHPEVNARYDDEAGVVTRHGSVHVGVATQTDDGLAVPVIRDAQERDIWALAREIARLAETTRAGKATRDELSGSTITVSSLGALGGIAATPVINRPEVAIIGINKAVDRAMVIEGRIEVRTMMNLSSSFDHRIVDGWNAASFIQEVKRLIENPLLLLSLR